MAEINPNVAIDMIHGKLKKSDTGYFYVRNGKQFYRDRDEKYQRNQSPKQKHNSEAFAYANAYSTPWAWKFNSLQFEYRQSHPFES